MSDFFDFFASVGLAIWTMLTLDSNTLGWFRTHPLNLQIAATVAALAGVSTLLGDSVVLFLNRVRGWRFLVTLLLNGAAMVLLYVLQALMIAVIGPLVVGHTPGLVSILRGVMLATAPMVFGFLGLIPYAGPAITRLLQAWGVLTLWIVVAVVFQADFFASLLITLIGWGAMQLLSWGLSRPVSWVGDRIWRVVTGKPSLMSGTDILSGQMFMPLDAEFRISGER
jgi:hypothetical protein